MDDKYYEYVNKLIDGIIYKKAIPIDFPLSLLDNEDFIVLACNEWTRIFEYASDRLKSDKTYLLRMVKESDYRVLEYVDKSILDDESFVRASVMILGDSLEYASSRLKKNKDIVLLAIAAPCREWEDDDVHSPLRYADSSLRGDRELALLAIRHNAEAYSHISAELQNDRELVLEAVSRGGYLLSDVPEQYKDDREIVLEAVSNWGYALEYASERLKNDKELIKLSDSFD